jgi:hypothetical protein
LSVERLPVGTDPRIAVNEHRVALIQLLGKRDAFKLAEAFAKISDQRLRNSLVALVVILSTP